MMLKKMYDKPKLQIVYVELDSSIAGSTSGIMMVGTEGAAPIVDMNTIHIVPSATADYNYNGGSVSGNTHDF